MPTATYYPTTADGRAEWWQNIIENSSAAFAAVGFAGAKVTGILTDAAWAVYTYRTIRIPYESYHQSVTAYANTIADGIGGTSGQALPPPPKWLNPPAAVITCDFEQRREDWVQEVKNSPSYKTRIGEILQILAPTTNFAPATYRTVLRDLKCPIPLTAAGNFRKSRGNVDGIVLRGRKKGNWTWLELGKFTATPFTTVVPLTGIAPEIWQFQARAFKDHVEFGLPSYTSSLWMKPNRFPVSARSQPLQIAS